MMMTTTIIEDIFLVKVSYDSVHLPEFSFISSEIIAVR